MSQNNMKKILVTGAAGQIGAELTIELRKRYGDENVIATGRKKAPSKKLLESGPFEFVDITKPEAIEKISGKHNIDTIYNMAAALTVLGEEKPLSCWEVNVNGLINILEIARKRNMNRVFVPSSIAVFGSLSNRDNIPQKTVTKPTTMYGTTKVASELLGDYYFRRFKLDVRGIRYPGIIGRETIPSGGTTDYAVEVFYGAIRNKSYTCFVKEDTILPFMYMPDCIKGTIDLMETDLSKLKHHCDFNFAAMSFSVKELADEIRKHIPEFTCEYKPDFRQAFADSWPRSIDDSLARKEWNWKPNYDLSKMTKDMLNTLGKRLKKRNL